MNHYLIQLIAEFNNLVALYYATYRQGRPPQEALLRHRRRRRVP
jgi:hypothetical protein